MKSSIAVALLAGAMLAQTAFAQTATARQQFELGANAYIKDGANAAIASWLKGSALEGNVQATSQANGLKQIEDFYGKPESFEVLRETQVSERAVTLLAVINFQKGPLYTRFNLYRLQGGGWVTA
ncbi:MAG: hypothetical protein E6Q67_08315 [Roseateles sp.]|nr:MAG: hypothetical protein E6Q67_08315 [Roseateles sp.]